MSKPLTEEQRRILATCEPGPHEADCLALCLARLDYLERKVAAADEVMDVIRSTLPLLVKYYDEMTE